MSIAVSTFDESRGDLTRARAGSTVEIATSLSASPERVWQTLRNFDSTSSPGLLKVLVQETPRTFIYEVTGLPRTVKTMVGEIRLQPDGAGTRLRWAVHFTTKSTMFARFLRPMMRLGIKRTLRRSVSDLSHKLSTTNPP